VVKVGLVAADIPPVSPSQEQGMAHLVRYSTPTGDDVFEDVDGLESAVARVEQLRNDGTATDARVYAEVPLRVETVVRVSVAPHTAPEPAIIQPPASDAPAAPEATEPSDASTEPGPAAPEASAPVPPLPGAMLAPVRVEAPSADAEDLIDADGTARRGLFHR
jgi:hypothetical protein